MKKSILKKKGFLRTTVLILSAVLLTAFFGATNPGMVCVYAGENKNRAAAVRMSDFILGLQLKNGLIPDAADAETVNEDSDMEYALMALAAAYQKTGAKKYLRGFERGIDALAKMEVMTAGSFQGSWWYRYDRNGRHLSSPMGNESKDVRGVDSTSALFVYLLELDQKCTGSKRLAVRYSQNAAAALHFLLNRSRTKDGFMASSFQMDAHGRWHRSDCCYSADQGDAWLGLRAGAVLYGRKDCAQAADFLKRNVPKTFFSEKYRRYCTGIEDGQQDWSAEGFDPVQSQGFLPWLWGNTKQNREAVTWLKGKVQASVKAGGQAGTRENVHTADPGGYFLSAAFLGLGEKDIGGKLPEMCSTWLLEKGMDKKSGGVYDTPQDHTETVNVAAFCAMALFSWSA